MISTIVLAPDATLSDDVGHVREVVVRSLVWLVSAVVSGVVRDVTLAAPPSLGLAAIADQAGCAIVEADLERDRLALAFAACREPLVLVLRTGYQPEPGMIEEIDSLRTRRADVQPFRLLAVPETAWQRLLPDRASCVGLLLDTRTLDPRQGFPALVRRSRRAPTLRARAVRLA